MNLQIRKRIIVTLLFFIVFMLYSIKTCSAVETYDNKGVLTYRKGTYNLNGIQIPMWYKKENNKAWYNPQYLYGSRIQGYNGLVAIFAAYNETNVGNKIMTVRNKEEITDEKYKNDIIESIASSVGLKTLTGNDLRTALNPNMFLNMRDSELYCLQHDASLIACDYVIANFIQIEGNSVTKYQHLDKNKGSYYRTDLKTSTITNTNNGKLAYILNESSYGRYGFASLKRHYAVRQSFIQWVDAVGSKIGVGNEWKWTGNSKLLYFDDINAKREGDKILTAANTYDNSQANIKIEGKDSKTVELDRINSPIITNISFKGSVVIEVRDTSGNLISDNDIQFIQEGKKIGKAAIKPNVNFQINNNSGKKIGKITFTETKNVYCANIWLAYTTGYFKNNVQRDKNGNPIVNSQRYGIVQHYTKPTTKKVELTVNYKAGNLKLTKKDLYSGDVIGGAEFEFWETTSRQSLSGTNGNYTLGSTRQKYKTDANGVINLTGIPVGTYEIYERSAPGYIVKQQKTTYYSDSWGSLMGSVTVTSGGNATKTIYNKKLRQFKID